VAIPHRVPREILLYQHDEENHLPAVHDQVNQTTVVTEIEHHQDLSQLFLDHEIIEVEDSVVDETHEVEAHEVVLEEEMLQNEEDEKCLLLTHLCLSTSTLLK